MRPAIRARAPMIGRETGVRAAVEARIAAPAARNQNATQKTFPKAKLIPTGKAILREQVTECRERANDLGEDRFDAPAVARLAGGEEPAAPRLLNAHVALRHVTIFPIGD